MDDSFGVEIEIETTESTTEIIAQTTETTAENLASRKRKYLQKKDNGNNIFKKTLWPTASPDAKIQALLAHKTKISDHAVLSTAYFVPLALLNQLNIRAQLYDVLTVRPKSKKFQGKETAVPWPLWHDRTAWVAIPRRLGVLLFGVPKQSKTHPGVPITFPLPILPLLTAVTCVACNGIDQETAVTTLETYLKATAVTQGFAACLYCIAPGFGKTASAAHLIQRLGRKALFIVPNVPFIDQVKEEMHKVLGPTVRVGTLATSDPKKWDLKDKDIVIAMAKSIALISYDLTEFGTVIVDECHELCTASYSQMFYRFGAHYVIGLTATPERADHCGAYLEWLVGPVLWNQQRDVSKLRWGGVIVTVYDVSYTFPIKETLLKSGEPYAEGMIRQIIQKQVRNDFMLEHVIMQRYREGRRILILGTRILHMEMLFEILSRQLGLSVGIIVGMHSDGSTLTTADRKEAQTKQILIASVAIVSKALNIPALDTAIILSGGTYVNPTHLTQLQGRITRDHATKKQPEFVLVRDCYNASTYPADGIFAGMVDAACKTLFTLSPGGFKFRTQKILLQEGTKNIQAQPMEDFSME